MNPADKVDHDYFEWVGSTDGFVHRIQTTRFANGSFISEENVHRIDVRIYIMDAEDYHEAREVPGVRASSGGISVVRGDIFQCKDADCMVTAGNSFGMMDGGIDGSTNYQFGMIEGRVQRSILEQWRGELPVGAAIVLPTEPTMHLRYRYLCYAPTMRLPQPVLKSLNAYLAMRAALIACGAKPDIRVIAVPLLCRGVGRMDVEEIVHQICRAWETYHRPTRADWHAINDAEQVLVGTVLPT
jgi:O-acetyl-ADP-ribose deacetylase (regulator of RNase III)